MGLKPRASAAHTPSRDELAPWIQTPPRLRAVFWCTFACAAADNEQLVAQLGGLQGIPWQLIDSQSPPTGRKFFVRGVPAYRRVAWDFERKQGRWQLRGSFREMGTFWGSNQAEWERFKEIALAHLDARDVVEQTR